MRIPVPRLRPDPRVSPKRVFYEQPRGVDGGLMALYQELGREVDVHPAAIRALAIVESQEKPFTPGGAPVVRFEARHWKKFREASRAALTFDRATNARDLDVRWRQFEAMRHCQEDPAILSHSFGAFQIMGFNHRACMCAEPTIFLAEMRTLEGQFRMLHRLLLNSPELLGALRKRDPQRVALHFNGRAYAQNQYDVKWASAAKSGGEGVWA